MQGLAIGTGKKGRDTQNTMDTDALSNREGEGEALSEIAALGLGLID